MSTLIIPAAGLATRLRPLSNNSSKCMVSINGKPIISYILDRVGSLFEKIVVVHGKSDDVVRFCHTKYSHLNIEFVKQETPEGPLHAVYCALCKIDNNDDPITIWLGDTIVTDYEPSSNTEVVGHWVPDWSRWCMIDEDGILYDKPEIRPPGGSMALVGIYTFDSLDLVKTITSSIVEQGIKVRGEFQISQLIYEYPDVDIVESNEWYDCGDLPSLYESSARLLQKFACRPDSDVDIDLTACTFTKTGDRCKNEIAWYNTIPPRVKPFVPNVYYSSENSYTMELLTGSTVADILLFEDLTKDGVRYIIRRCLDSYRAAFLEHGFKMKLEGSDQMFFVKNNERVSKYDKAEKGIYLAYSSRIAEQFEGESLTCIVPCHGDFHLGNIIFSPENGRVKFIDPRGKWNDNVTNLGIAEYDLIKFAQSIAGEYLWIYAGMPTNILVQHWALEVFCDWCKELGFNYDFIINMVPIFMGSVLEFHTDSPERQARIWKTTIDIIRGME